MRSQDATSDALPRNRLIDLASIEDVVIDLPIKEVALSAQNHCCLRMLPSKASERHAAMPKCSLG